MRGNYAPDTFTESDVLAALEGAGLKHKNGHRYILSQCPTHEDQHPSVQIYKDDWFANCHAGCGRFHITKAFPDLRRRAGNYAVYGGQNSRPNVQGVKKVMEHKYIAVDLMEQWKAMPLIPRDHYFKDIDLDTLDELGWRWDEKGNRYFIPYFSRSKTSIPFAQWRNLGGNVRFNFWKDAKPTIYGTWNLEKGEKLFLVEGCSDAAVLDHCAIPWIAAPSAASGELVKALGSWCAENNVELVYAGDNDAAGDKLKDALDQVTSYRVLQPRQPNKDWGDMYESEGFKSVMNYVSPELFPGDPLPFPEIEPGYKAPEEFKKPDNWSELSDVEKVQSVIPGAVELKVVGGAEGKKQLEPSTPTPQVLF